MVQIVNPSVELITHTPNAEAVIEQCGRICYKSDIVKCPKCLGNKHVSDPEETPDQPMGWILCPECDGRGWIDRDYGGVPNHISAAGFTSRILDRGHEAVIEMADITLKFITDRGITHETVRHRIASYLQESTRYCNYGKNKFGNEITVVMPPGMGEKGRIRWARAMENDQVEYLGMLEDGETPQIAHSVLGNSLKTEIAVKFNLRQWRHFLQLRMAPAAHPQIRQCAVMALPILRKIAPTVFGDSEFLPKDQEAESWFSELSNQVANDHRIPGWFNYETGTVFPSPHELVMVTGFAEWDYTKVPGIIAA